MSLLDAEIITIKRRTTGSYVQGHYVDGTESSSAINANVQPLTGKEILQLIEADRIRESLKILTVSEIRVNDTVVRGGKNYEVQKIADFSGSTILPHYEAVMLLIEGQ